MTLIHRAAAVAAGVLPALALVVVLAAGPAAAVVSAPPGVGTSGTIDSISCASAGNCSAVGEMAPPSGKVLFAVTEENGVWGTAGAVPGLAALLGRTPVGAHFTEVSCSSAGNCGAGGSYSPNADVTQAFVVSEKNGVWGKAERVPGSKALNVGHDAQVQAVSCRAPGNCSAGGLYTISHDRQEAFVVSEKHGTWGNAREVPGLAQINTLGYRAGFNQIACTSAGNCLGIGLYTGSGSTDPFAVTEKNGIWGQARTFPRIVALSSLAGFAEITSIACSSPGNCTGLGISYFSVGRDAAFVLSQKNGIWERITRLSMTALAPAGNRGVITPGSLSCPSQGSCTADGDFASVRFPGQGQAWIATEQNGSWGNAMVPPGVAALTADSMTASISGLVCRSAGNCSAAGAYGRSPDGQNETYVVTEKNGVWGSAAELPGIPPLDASQSFGAPVLSCGARGNCSLGGSFSDPPSFPNARPYLASEENGIWGNAEEVKGIDP